MAEIDKNDIETLRGKIKELTDALTNAARFNEYNNRVRNKDKWGARDVDFLAMSAKDFWKQMSKESKEFWSSQKTFTEEYNYRRSRQKIEGIQNGIRDFGFDKTKLGGYASGVASRYGDIHKMSKGTRELSSIFGKASKGLEAKGLARSSKALGTFSKSLGSVSKLLGGPVTAVIFAVIEAFKLVSAAVASYNDYTTKEYKYQTEQNKAQYELDKKNYEINKDIKAENIAKHGDLALKELDVQGQNLIEGLKITLTTYTQGVETAVGSFSKGINKSAYDAARYGVEASANIQKYGLQKSKREQEQGRYIAERELENQAKLASLEADRRLVSVQTEIEMKTRAMSHKISQNSEHQLWSLVRGTSAAPETKKQNNPVTGQPYNETSKSVYEVGGNAVDTSDIYDGNNIVNALTWATGIGGDWYKSSLELNTAKLEAASEAARQQADYNKTMMDKEYELGKTALSYQNKIQDKQLEITTETSVAIIDAASEIKKMWLNVAQDIEQWTEKYDTTMNDLGKNLGYTNREQLLGFERAMYSATYAAAEFGRTPEDVAKFQGGFAMSTGRNRLFGDRDYRALFALGDLVGDDGLATSYTSEMEIFNVGVNESVNLLGEAVNAVNRMGLNGRKYAKTIADSLKLAQKYNFKGGTENLMKIAKWAENTRFNMQSISGMLDKISEGGLEGLITQGAQFQVLGGHAAMNADPIAMWYERYSDPESFLKRMQDMTIGFGQVDKLTGETKFSQIEQMTMEQLAKIQGRAVEDVMNEVRARNKREVVAKALTGSFNDDQLSFIANNATFNRATQRFETMVKGANGYEAKGISELTQSDLDLIMPQDHNERVEDYMQDIISLLQMMTGAEWIQKAALSEATFDTTIEEYKKRLDVANENFTTNYDQYVENIKKAQEEATKSYTDFVQMALAGNEAVDQKIKDLDGTSAMLNAELTNTASLIAQANVKIAQQAGIEYTPKVPGVSGTGGNSSGSSNSTNTTKLEINGKVVSENGGSTDLANYLLSNPTVLRKVTQLIMSEVAKSQNGGRSKQVASQKNDYSVSTAMLLNPIPWGG